MAKRATNRPASARLPVSFLPAPAVTDPPSLPALLGTAMRRRGGRRAVSAIVVVMFVGAIGLFAAPAFTDLIGAYHQHELRSEFSNPRLKTLYRSGDIPIGDDLTKLEVDNPRVHIGVLVVQGTTTAALEAGAGHYVNTPLPCEVGNVGIAGHRTTYGRPFNKINEMLPGDTVTLVTPVGQCVYRVVPPKSVGLTSYPWIVQPNDVAVVSQAGRLRTGHWLTLTSCNPPGSAAQRIVVRLKMISSTVAQAVS